VCGLREHVVRDDQRVVVLRHPVAHVDDDASITRSETSMRSTVASPPKWAGASTCVPECSSNVHERTWKPSSATLNLSRTVTGS